MSSWGAGDIGNCSGGVIEVVKDGRESATSGASTLEVSSSASLASATDKNKELWMSYQCTSHFSYTYLGPHCVAVLASACFVCSGAPTLYTKVHGDNEHSPVHLLRLYPVTVVDGWAWPGSRKSHCRHCRHCSHLQLTKRRSRE